MAVTCLLAVSQRRSPFDSTLFPCLKSFEEAISIHFVVPSEPARHYAGCFEAPEALDLTGPLGRLGFQDPVYVIRARKRL